MTALQYVLSILSIIVSIIIIVLVCLQESKQKGLSGAIGGASETFFGKNKSRTQEAKLAMLTKVFGTIFFILALVSALLFLFGA